KMVQIPYGAEVDVEVISSEFRELSLEELGITKRIIPVQPPIPKIEGAWEKAEFVIHEDFYQTDQFFPTQVAQKGEIAAIRGHRFVMVEVYPVSYNPVSGRLKLYSDIKVRVNLTGSDVRTTEVMLARYASPPFEEICADLFINYSTYSDLLKGIPLLPIGYLIIVHEDFYDNLAPLVEWKTKKGFHVTVLQVPDIGTSTAAIKDSIESAYYNWPIPPTYVLLFGDVGWIPTYNGTYSYSATDLYYVQMDGDRFADIGRARFPVRNTSEATDMVNKLLYYENPTSPDLEWMRHECFLASSDHGQMAEFTHRYVIYNYLVPNGVIVDSVWERLGGGTQDIFDCVNGGTSVLCYSGHGYSGGWGCVPFDQDNVEDLSNQNEYPLVLSHACSTNPFDYTECFGETWVKVPNKGGIAFWGASSGSYWDEDDILEKGMFKAAFEDTCYSVVSMTDKALWYLYQYYGDVSTVRYYFDMYNVNGDPSVDIWTYIAEDLLVDFPPTIAMAPSEVTITVETESGPLYGALVCLRKGDEVFETGYTDAAGQVILYPSPLTPGNVELAITGHNVLPLEDSIIVAPGAYIVFESWSVDDDSLGESLGNGDGDVDLGETIELPILLKNMGDSTAFNVEATLSTTHPQVTMVDDHEIYGDIPAHETMWCPDDFDFAVSPEIGDSEVVFFQLDITADNGSWTRSDLSLLVHAPVLAYESKVIDDFDGNGDGEPDPGETCDMTVVLKNEGSQGAVQVSADLICDDPYVTITASGSNYPDIPPNGSENSLVPYQFSADSSCSLGHIAEFVLEVTGAGPYSTSDTFQIKIGRKPVLLVDDDDGESYDTFFVSALNSLEIPYDVWEYDLLGLPSDSVLGSYKAIVWTTGDDFGVGSPSTLTAEDQAKLQTYLDNGGRLFLSSQDLLYDNDPNEFIINYLHVAGHTDDAGINSVAGVAEDVITDGMSISLSYPFSNLSDYIVPGPDATGIFYRTGKTSPSSREGRFALPSFQLEGSEKTDYCALRYPATGTAGYQVVFFAFPFEAIPQSGANPNNAKMVMGEIMDWFGISKPSFTRGDANGDGEINIADVILLVNYLFLDGPEPFPLEAGDADCSGEVDIADVIFLINYLFTGGPPPSC
ncbi:MAG: hypothetical protein KAW16_06860, partial [candidate division Zixibacteria bacterium]|nr:hypothetical protein [candidate division Zixibacteria bacterium]